MAESDTAVCDRFDVWRWDKCILPHVRKLYAFFGQNQADLGEDR